MKFEGKKTRDNARFMSSGQAMDKKKTQGKKRILGKKSYSGNTP